MDRVLVSLVLLTIAASSLVTILLYLITPGEPTINASFTSISVGGYIEFVSGGGYYRYFSRGVSFTIPPSTRVRVVITSASYTTGRPLAFIEVECSRGVIRVFHIPIESVYVASAKVADYIPSPVLELYAIPGTIRLNLDLVIPAYSLKSLKVAGRGFSNVTLVVRGLTCSGADRVLIDLEHGVLKGMAREALIVHGKRVVARYVFNPVALIIAPYIAGLLVAGMGLLGIGVYLHYRSKTIV